MADNDPFPRISGNLPPKTLLGDDEVGNAAVKVAYVDGARQGFGTVLDFLQEEYLKPEIKPGSTEGEAILNVARKLGAEIREYHRSLDRL